jgi:hypothetical protein
MDDEVMLYRMLDQAVANEPPIGPVVERAVVAGRQIRRRRRIAGALGCFALVAVAGGLIPVLGGPRSPGLSATSGRRTVSAPSTTAPGCGKFCGDLYLSEFGPSFVLDVDKQAPAVGQPVIMFAASSTDPGEDWTFTTGTTVHDFYQAGLISRATALHYGKDEAYEIEYAPAGASTGLCMGVRASKAYEEVRLEKCGMGAQTVWFSTAAPQPGHAVTIMNGLDKGTSTPLVLTFPATGYPTDVPRPPLSLMPLAPGRGASSQQWE